MDAETLRKHNELLKKLSVLPRKIVSLHGSENIPEFVLYDLCQQSVLNLPKAAYFVDNPDFDWLKGVAGFDSSDTYKNDIWQDPSSFTHHMQQSPFNQKVRTISMKSSKHIKTLDEVMSSLAEQLNLQSPACFTWNLKHDNHGILLVENRASCQVDDEDILNGAHFLSFCPVH